jgi:hypothetical protein
MNSNRDREHDFHKQDGEEQDFDEIKLQFIADWEEGSAPTLQNYLQRFPQFREQIVDFVLFYAPMRRAGDRVTDSPIPSESTLKIIEETVARTALPVQNLTQARQAKKWSVGQVAQQLNLPNELVLRLLRGYEEWPSKLEHKIASVFNWTPWQAHLVLSSTKPIVPTQAKATGQPQAQTMKRRSFQADLEEFDREGKLTAEQRQEWIEVDE